jgi:LacI family transcriptional regulator
MPRPTIKTVARLAGVSVGSVSNVLSGKDHVGAEVRQQVLRAVAETGYRPNAVAASLRSQRSRSIGLCIPDLGNPFFSQLQRRINDATEADGYELIIAETREDGTREAEKIAALCAHQIDGLMIVPTAGWRGDLPEGVASVLIDRGGDFGLRAPLVTLDNEAAGAACFAHLRALGHCRIWMVVNTLGLWNSAQRVEGFLRAAEEAGLRGKVRVIEGGMTALEMGRAVHAHLGVGPVPDAILTGSGNMTLGALRALQEAGLRAGDDVALMGFDDSSWMEVLRPSISVLRQPTEAIAQKAWNLLHAQVRGEEVAPVHHRLGGVIIARDSAPPAISGDRHG